MKSEDSEQTEDVTAECVTSLNVFALLLFVEVEPVLYDVAVVKLGRNGSERYCFCCQCPDLVFLTEG